MKLGGEETPAPASTPLPQDNAETPDLGGEPINAAPGEVPTDDKPFDDQPFDAGVQADEDSDPKKFIEQLTGKLGQSLRKYNETQASPDLELEKFAVNSLLAATHTGKMDDEDKKDIIKKVETAGSGEEGSEKPEDDQIDAEAPGADMEAPTGEAPADAAPAASADAPVNEMALGDHNVQALIKIYDNGSDTVKQVLTRLVSFSNKVNRDEFLNDLQDEIDYDDLDEIFTKLKEYGVERPKEEVAEGAFFLDKPKKNNMFQEGSNDILETPLNPEEKLPVAENVRIFADKEKIKSILKESFNEEDMSTQPATKPATQPKTKPSTQPSKPSRRDKPFQPVVTPGVKPAPKADLDEAKYDYPLYHGSFSSAVQAAEEYAKKMGYTVNEDDWFTQISTGPAKPSEGKTNRYSVEIYKNGKLSKKRLHIQVYGMGTKWELNCYIN